MNPSWTRKVPTIPGWYWWKCGEKAPSDLILVKENGLCQLHGVGYWVKHTTGLWAGPLLPPEEL